jgi:hypothetical protein
MTKSMKKKKKKRKHKQFTDFEEGSWKKNIILFI